MAVPGEVVSGASGLKGAITRQRAPKGAKGRPSGDQWRAPCRADEADLGPWAKIAWKRGVAGS